MIFNTFEEALQASKKHFEKQKKYNYDATPESEHESLDNYYSVVSQIYDIRQTCDCKFEYPEDGAYVGNYSED